MNKDTKNIKRLLKQSVINKPEKTCGVIKTAKLPQGRFTTQGGRTQGVRKIFIILNLLID